MLALLTNVKVGRFYCGSVAKPEFVCFNKTVFLIVHSMSKTDVSRTDDHASKYPPIHKQKTGSDMVLINCHEEYPWYFY